MTSTTRIQHRYDHRLRELVQSTSDVEYAIQRGVPRSTVLSATTFCSFLREFSPLEVCAGGTRNVRMRRFRSPGRCFRSIPLVQTQVLRSRAERVPSDQDLLLWLLRNRQAQLEINVSGSHVGHDVLRFTSNRDWRASFLPVSSSWGMCFPVPKYISSGV